MTLRILIVDDDPLICEQLTGVARDAGYEAQAATDAGKALQLLAGGSYDLGIVDLKMPDIDGITLMQEMRSRAPELAVIMITGHGSIKGAVDAIRQGASNYITKPFDRDEILHAIQQVMERRRLIDEINYLRKQLEDRYSFANMVSQNPAMRELFATVEMLAQNDSTVLITGESGTGKELVARAIHFHGKRREGRFVALNCAAVPEQLLESELFGFERGAFTGASHERVGKIEWASGGTLFLDEVESIPLSMQAKLLRVIENHAIERLGGNRLIPVDMRVVAASNRDLAETVRSGGMREDFYYRINVVPLRVPPLRDRSEDIPLLAAHFLEHNAVARERHIKAVSERAITQLKSHSWPGNIRELQNVLERAALRTKGDVISDVDVGRLESAPQPPRPQTEVGAPLREFLRAAEREYLVQVLDRYAGAVSASARHASIDQATLHRKIKAHGLRPADFRGRNGRASANEG